jgi:2-haloacid dehalogenase
MLVVEVTADREALFSIFSDPGKFYAADPYTFLFTAVLVLVFGTGKISVDSALGYLCRKRAAGLQHLRGTAALSPAWSENRLNGKQTLRREACPSGSPRRSAMKRRIQAVVFDAYGTLFDVHSVITLCNRKFPGQGAELSKLWRTKQLEYTWLRSLTGRYEDFWMVTESALVFACRSLNLACSPQTCKELMESYLHLETFPEVKSTLGKLSQKKLAILSNGSPKMLTAAVENAGLGGVFTDLISADEVRIYKSSPRVYGLVSQHLGVPDSAIAFVSSNFWDIAGAKSFGFWTGWVNRHKLPEDELGVRPDVTVDALDGLIGVMGGMT